MEQAAHTSEALGLMDELTVVLVVGLIGGLLAMRFRLPPIVGFLAAGVMLGPHTPGFVANTHQAEQLGEIGVAFLMFGVGLHFSIRDLITVRNIAVPGAVVQSVLATALTIGVVALFGWTIGAGLVLGLALSVASTVVLVRALMSRNKLDSDAGRIAVGWLVVEDLFSALVLVLLPVLAVSLGGTPPASRIEDSLTAALMDKSDSILGFAARQVGVGDGVGALVAITLVNVAVVVALLPLARRGVNWLLEDIDRSGSEEMLTLAAVVIALVISVGMVIVFGLSVALGAFFAGIIVSGSRLSHRVAEDIRPLRDLFGVLFFTSVGMLFDPMTPFREPIQVVAVVLIIVLAKPVIAAAIALVLHQSRDTALTIGAGLAQIGEFSFILGTLGRVVGLLPDEAYQLIITGAIISIAVNPLAFRAAQAVLRSWAPAPATPRLVAINAAGAAGSPGGVSDERRAAGGRR
jgi:CPA2 family monovalent cation:H+ antiporter-2